MPVAGVPRNPLGQTPDRFHSRTWLLLSRRQDHVGRTTTLVPGVTVRVLWRNLVNYLNSGGSADFNWTLNTWENSPDVPRGPVTTSLRYLISTLWTVTAGNQRSMPIVRPPIVRQRQSPAPPLVYAGNLQGRPVLRNRMVSFGSRVPPVNGVSPDSISGS